MRKLFIVFLIFFINQTVVFAEMSLTGSDGTGLMLKSVKAQAVLEGVFAFTEIELVFYNPEDRQREGRFQITLPQGAAVSRFAMSRNGQLLEGEVVERQLAQRAYEDFLHQRQDPALLEVDQGNRFNARVFPIVAHEIKRIIISYSQTLNDGNYLFPLKDLPQVESFSLHVLHDGYFADNKFPAQSVSGMDALVSNKQLIKIEQKNYKPQRDFIMPLKQIQETLALKSGNVTATRLIPFPATSTASAQQWDNWVVLIDTSASQGPYLQQTLQDLIQLKEQIKPRNWQVFSFDQVFRRHGSLEQIKEVQALGASNLEQAFERLNREVTQKSHLIIISDVVATSGTVDVKKLTALLNRSKKFDRIDVLLPSAHHDHDIGNALRLGGNVAGILADLKLGGSVLLHKLTTPCHAKVALNVIGSKWFWPQTLDAIQEGEAVTVFAEMEDTQHLQIKIEDKLFSPSAIDIEPLLLKREWARARVERLNATMLDANDPDMRAAMIQQIIKVSLDERIVTPYTSLLVLESSADYQRYGIQPQAMADILTIGLDGVSVINRREIPQIEATAPTSAPKPEFESQDKVETDVIKKRDNQLGDVPVEAAKSMPQRAKRDRKFEPAASGDRILMSPPPPMPSESVTASTSSSEANKTLASQPPQTEMARQRPQAATERLEEPPLQASNHAMPAMDSEGRISPWEGEYKRFRDLLAKNDLKQAGKLVGQWRQDKAQDLMALIALGEYFEATKEYAQASRAYGSLVDYFPARADIRRWAAGRLLRFKDGYALALDSLIKAVEQRPDHPSGYYLLAWAYWLNDNAEAAKKTLRQAAQQSFPRFAGSQQILSETLALMTAKEKQNQIRFVLTWETDANDVDFHVHDAKNNHAYYGSPNLASGGHLYHDITTGYGPENFTITNPRQFPYRLSAHYYSKGPMGYGMGVLNVLRYEAKSGNIRVEFRPYVVMTDRAFVDLGKVDR